MHKIYTRKVKGGGITLYQLIFLSRVFSLSKNTCGSNGKKHGWRLSIKKRNETAL
jgi:hypothetical protein